MNSDQVVFKLTAEILDLFLSFKMRKKLVVEKELCFSARDGTAYARQIMQLPEGAGESRFTALVRARYDNYALFSF